MQTYSYRVFVNHEIVDYDTMDAKDINQLRKKLLWKYKDRECVIEVSKMMTWGPSTIGWLSMSVWMDSWSSNRAGPKKTHKVDPKTGGLI